MSAVAEQTVREAAEEAVGHPEAEPRRATRAAETAIGLGVVALGVGAIVAAQQLADLHAGGDFGGRWWPTVVGGCLAVLGAASVVSGLLRPPAVDVEPLRRTGVLQLAAILGLVVAYGIAWQYVHFAVVTLALVAAIMAVLGGRGWRQLVLVPAIVTAVLYGVFGLLLRVPL